MDLHVFHIYKTILAGFFPGLFVVAASYAECNKLLVVAFFLISVGFQGNYYCSTRVNGLDLSPNYAGSILAITNGSGAICGVMAPIFVGYMTPDVNHHIFTFTFFPEKLSILRLYNSFSVDTRPMEIRILDNVRHCCSENYDLLDLGVR